MRWRRYQWWNRILSAVFILLLVAWVVGPFVGLTVPLPVMALGAVLLLAVNLTLLFRTARAMRADAARVVAAHPGTIAFPTGISSWPGSDRAVRDSVIAVTADRHGLSFRDHEDHEVLLVPADRVMSVELAPLVLRSRFRPLRVTTIDTTIDFGGPATPDQQVDAVVGIREALSRPAA